MPRIHSIAAIAALLLPVVGALAASNISARYDGVYSGQALPVPAMSTGVCPAFNIGPVVIAKGILRSQKGPDRPDVSGFITEEGYVQASMTGPDGAKIPLDGRLENGTISAGLIDAAAGCAWLVDLRPQTPPG